MLKYQLLTLLINDGEVSEYRTEIDNSIENKKLREKDKSNHRRDKEHPRRTRKMTNDKGKSFMDMLMYVDANGKLSQMPPEPPKVERIK